MWSDGFVKHSLWPEQPRRQGFHFCKFLKVTVEFGTTRPSHLHGSTTLVLISVICPHFSKPSPLWIPCPRNAQSQSRSAWRKVRYFWYEVLLHSRGTQSKSTCKSWCWSAVWSRDNLLHVCAQWGHFVPWGTNLAWCLLLHLIRPPLRAPPIKGVCLISCTFIVQNHWQWLQWESYWQFRTLALGGLKTQSNQTWEGHLPYWSRALPCLVHGEMLSWNGILRAPCTYPDGRHHLRQLIILLIENGWIYGGDDLLIQRTTSWR